MTKRRRQAVHATILGVALAATGLVTSATATTSTARRYTYVAAGFHVVGPDLAAGIVADETGVRTAPLGWVGIVPDTERFTLRIADRNPASPHVAVTMVSRDWRRNVCAPRDRDVVVDDAPVGQHVSLFVWETTAYHESWCPTSFATTGTLAITP